MTARKQLPVLYCDGHKVVIADSDEKILPGNIWTRYIPDVPRCATCDGWLHDGEASNCLRLHINVARDGQGYCSCHPEAKP